MPLEDFKRVSVTDGIGFHAPFMKIPYIPPQPQPVGPFLNEPAKPDALHSTGNKELLGGNHFKTRRTRIIAEPDEDSLAETANSR